MMLVAILPKGIGSSPPRLCLPPPSRPRVVDGAEPGLPSRSTCACVEYYGKALESLVKGVKIMCIHGKMKHKRNKIFMEFRKLQRWVSCRGGHPRLGLFSWPGILFSALCSPGPLSSS